MGSSGSPPSSSQFTVNLHTQMVVCIKLHGHHIERYMKLLLLQQCCRNNAAVKSECWWMLCLQSLCRIALRWELLKCPVAAD